MFPASYVPINQDNREAVESIAIELKPDQETLKSKKDESEMALEDFGVEEVDTNVTATVLENIVPTSVTKPAHVEKEDDE